MRKLRMVIPVLLLASWCHAAEPDPLALITEYEAAHADGRALCSFAEAPYRGDTKTLPIGVFDSGIGGLTVLEAMLKIDVFQNATLQPGGDGTPDFAQEHFVYFGDQANMPYGNYSAAGRVDLLRELILRDAVFLLSQRVKAIVIACNTATAYGLQDIRAAVAAWKLPVPVIGVVEAGARGVLESLPGAGEPEAIAVLATVGTCSCEAYPKAISHALGLAGRSIPKIEQEGCVGLAGAIEGDPAFVSPTRERQSPYAGPKPDRALWPVYGFDDAGMLGDEINSVANHVRYEVATLVEHYHQSGATTPLGLVVLGCTHFPLVKNEIAAAFARLRTYRDASGAQPYATLIREQVTLIDPAEFTARELFRELARTRLRLKPGEKSAVAADTFYMSVPNPNWAGIRLTAAGALDITYKHGRPLGEFTREDVLDVPIRSALLPSTSAHAIEQLMPEVWRRLSAP